MLHRVTTTNRPRRPVAKPASGAPRTLAIDVGGTGLKASVLNASGAMLAERVRVPTPYPCPPDILLATLAKFDSQLPAFDRVSIGFPGVVRGGRVLGKPTRVANDADLQGAAVVKGKGLELVITLGTGVGTGLYEDGRLAPHLEIAHHPFRKGQTYNEQLGEAARKRLSSKKWNARVKLAVATLDALLFFDHVYIGGGNATRVTVDLGPKASLVDNAAGILGGIKLWDQPRV
jgi:polyphosphate glucokinase